MTSAVCPKCGKTTLYEGEAPKFCAHCGGEFKIGEKKDEALDKLLKNALSEGDTAKRYQLLLKAREAYPDCYEVEKEILFLGRLYERGGKPDFYRIPYWPLAAYENPGEFSRKKREEMLTRFFENPEIDRVADLLGDKDAFWEEYLFRMAKGYVDLFLKGNNANSTFFGFRRREGEIMKRCAQSLVRMLANIEKADYPDEKLRKTLVRALWTEFVDAFDGASANEWLLGYAEGRVEYRP